MTSDTRGETCATCVYCTKDRSQHLPAYMPLGQCRRYPPLAVPDFRIGDMIELVKVQQERGDPYWPTVNDKHWCGEWRAIP